MHSSAAFICAEIGDESREPIDLGQTVRSLSPGMSVFKRYRLKKMLGRGGMGIVWLALDERLERDVALKLLPEMLFLDSAARDDLKRETRKSLDLTHPNIIRIYDFVEDEQAAAISMEYIDGATLSHLRIEKTNKIFEPAELTAWMPALCAALGYAHESARLVHRDLKAANIMVTSRGILKIADFGIACSLMNSVNRVSMWGGSGGTLAYMSPQQMQGEQPSALDDIYALGATLYELFTSKPPFHSGNLTLQVREVVPDPIAKRRALLDVTGEPVPEVWENAIAACLAKNPAQRPQSAGALLQLLGIGAPTAPLEMLTSRSAALIPQTPAPERGVQFLNWVYLAVGAVFLISAAILFHHKPEHQQAVNVPQAVVVTAPAAVAPILHGGLMVKTSPPGATVSLGGDAVETTPATFKGIQTGDYPVHIVLEGYEPVDLQAEISANRFNDLGTVALTRSVGGLQIMTTPEGCDFEISRPDTKPVTGQSPQTIRDLPTGTYAVKIARAGWPDFTRTIEIKRGATDVIEWKFGQGTLVLNSDPVGATVSVGNRELGKTPLNIPLPAGKYDGVQLALDGYDTASVSAVVETDQTTSPETVPLHQTTGTLYFSSTPAGAEILLDGNSIGVTPLTFEAPLGKHEVLARLEDYPDRKKTISLAKGEAQKVQFAMRSSSGVHHARHVAPPPTAWDKIGNTLKNVFHH